MHTIVVSAFYHFVTLTDYTALQAPLEALCTQLGVKGSVLLAREGINGTLAGDRSAIANVLAWLRNDPRLQNLEDKQSTHDAMPFYRLKIKLKKEIVSIGIPSIDPTALVGTYVEAKDWNALISQNDVLTVDTRNTYETRIGTFAGATDPNTQSFRDFPNWAKAHVDPKRHKKVAMFCTGGIRCEKATSLLLSQGVEEVFHLKGGILKYMQEVPAEKSLWRGECFVFDQRVALTHNLQQGHYDLCHGCRQPLHQNDKSQRDYSPGVACPKCAHTTTQEQKQRFTERQKQITLSKQRNQTHLGSAEEIAQTGLRNSGCTG